ncbi:MAG TPA: DUF488 domain-containing protein [Pyrinomonadaceae bacterium]|jgi:Uncharacterized conserved protein|nr:DUF488 domain-containing protein [Pyrinomonadaceae bacterium]
MKEKPHDDLQVWTVGHSTRTAEEFRRLLEAHKIETLIDVRSFPGSRRYPQFNKAALAGDLTTLDIKYLHAPLLGGRRQANASSKNTAWKNASFRAYADYMETHSFKQGISELLEVASKDRSAVMCAEALWWRCHRSLISDYLKANHIAVVHILDEKKTEVHPYTSAARIVNGKLSYRGLLESES